MARIYGQLKTDVSGYLAGAVPTATIPTLIQLCEDRISTDIETLRQEKTLEGQLAAMDGDIVPLPNDFLSQRDFSLNTNDIQRLDYLTPEVFYEEGGGNQPVGRPFAYTIIGTNLILSPPPDAQYDYRLSYFGVFDRFTDDADTNWLLENHYGLYLYGSLAESAPYLGNDPRTLLWATMYDERKDAVNQLERKARFPTGDRTRRANGVAVY